MQSSYKKILIGLVGKKGAGKSTISRILREKGFSEYAFADPIKEILQILFFLKYEELHGNAKEKVIEELGVSPRRLMQQMGTDMFRNNLHECIPELNTNGKTIWIWNLERKIRDSTNQYIVISDVRFEDEMNLIKDMGGMIVQIKNPNIKNDDTHISELLNLPSTNEHKKGKTDFCIDNDGTIQELENRVWEFLDFIVEN